MKTPVTNKPLPVVPRTLRISEALSSDARHSLAEDIVNHEPLIDKVTKPSILKVQSVNLSILVGEALGMQPQLCGPLWYEGELCVLFADTNVGKSVLAVQIAEMIARGCYTDTTIPELRPQTDPRKVLYIDFEMSSQQFTKRYTSPDDDICHYRFSENLYRAEIDYLGVLASDDDKVTHRRLTMGDLVYGDIEKIVASSGCKVVIIDNITFLADGTETAADALPLMKKLIALKKKYNLSILILAHTPKRNLSNPITHNDLQGSKMIINFVDSAFAIGSSATSTNVRYIKQLKQRNCECKFHGGNVLDCVIDRTSPQFLGFKSIGTGPEARHLEEGTPKSPAVRRDMIIDLHNQGLSHKEIAAKLGVSLAQIYRHCPVKGNNNTESPSRA